VRDCCKLVGVKQTTQWVEGSGGKWLLKAIEEVEERTTRRRERKI
jgi:hypothetical protein